MLRAVVEDFERVPDVHVLTLLADDFSGSIGRHGHKVARADEPQAFRKLATEADAALIIAPEIGNLLARRTGWAVAAGCRILGCTHEQIRLTGDKFKLACWLHDRQIPTPPTHCLSTIAPAADSFPCMLKPRCGAGSQATFLIRIADDWSAVLRQALAEYPSADLIVQPFHPGQAASVAFFVGRNQIVPTPGATQHLSDDGCFHYLGGRVPLPQDLRDRAVPLAQRAVESVPGLQGFVGVDLILGDAADGSQDVVVEINPRLTTSYIGLRQLTRTNLAEVWLRLWKGEIVEAPDWSDDVIEFSAGIRNQGSGVRDQQFDL